MVIMSRQPLTLHGPSRLPAIDDKLLDQALLETQRGLDAAALLFRIGRIIIGEQENFLGAQDLLKQHNVKLIVRHDARCSEMMRQFIHDHRDLWNEDIGL